MKKRIIKAIREKVITFSLISAMILGVMPANAFAAENATLLEPSNFESNISAITPRAGEETWDVSENQHYVGNFTFTNTNTSPLKTILGNYVQFQGVYRKADCDAGVGNVVLSIGLKDENGNFIAGPWPMPQTGDTTYFQTPKWGLYRPGIKFHIWYDASSAGTSNGHYRSIEIVAMSAYVSN